MANEKTHVDGAVERIENEIGVEVLAQFTATDAAAQSGISLFTAWPQEAIPESCNQVFVALTGGEDGGNDAAARAAKYLYQLAHLAAHVGEDGSGIGEAKITGGVAGKGVSDQRALVGPPAINGSLADTGAIGNIFDREIGKPAVLEDAQSAAQNSLARLFAAGTPRRPFPIPIFAV